METNIQEIWKDVVGYPNYQVSNLGNVFSRKRNQLLTPVKNTNKGYFRVLLYDGIGSSRKILIHRLVAEHFIPNPENKPQVNHKFGVTTDNRASQLEWVTPSENMKHSYDVLKIKRNGRIVYQFDTYSNLISIHPSRKKAAEVSGAPIGVIRWYLDHPSKKEKKPYKGFRWSYSKTN